MSTASYPIVRVLENMPVRQKSSKLKRPREHREPTPGTVKQLYGTAFECARPDCHEDLYKVNKENGKRVLNSRVAHIYARSEGGPRWDKDMSEADNRDVANLLLLCLRHAWEIDDLHDLYPPEMLQAWKAAQLAAYAEARKGWEITDAEAAEAVAPLDLVAAIDKLAAVVPFSPRMRSRTEAWQRAARKGRGRRVARLTPLVAPERRDALLAWMSLNPDPVPEVPAGQLRVLVARMGAGKSEHAARWWEQGLQEAANDPDIEIPVFFTARQVVSGLEQSVVDEIGGDPARLFRVVIDDLDGVPAKDAGRLLMEARELVQVWPSVSVLATARPGIPLAADERLDVTPWSARRGADLAGVALGQDVPWHLWTKETLDLLASPLSALALAARVHAGRDTKVSRTELLSGLVEMIIESRGSEVSDDTWHDLMALAVRILGSPENVTAASFTTPPRVRRLVATDLVVNDGGNLAFALPIFEQYFGSQAITTGLAKIDAVASADAFPRWRFALAFAVTSAQDAAQEALMLSLAKTNRAAAFWVLGEIGQPEEGTGWDGPSDSAIASLIGRRDHTGIGAEPVLPIRAGLWLREAEQALLTGAGPLAPAISRHRDGQLVQWGVWLQNGYLTVARSRRQTPPPQVVALEEIHPKIGRSGWASWEQFQFPVNDMGRWQRAQIRMQEKLLRSVKRRTLAAPAESWLARERLYHLAQFVTDFGIARRVRPIKTDELREKVDQWMAKVRDSERASWQNGEVDSDDVRWLSARLESIGEPTITPPWPSADIPYHSGKWAWQGFSPELTLTMATGIVTEAITGYLQLVQNNFPAFGDALGLYSMLPAQIDGVIGRFEDETEASSVEVRIMLHTDRRISGSPPVNLKLVAHSEDRAFWDFGSQQSRKVVPAFGHNPLQNFGLPLHVDRPATNLAYKWLSRDLAAVGWLQDSIIYFD